MIQPPKSVALHIGAHKTATTHLQRSFAMQQGALNAAGVRYYGPESLRKLQRGLGDIFGLDVYDNPSTPTRSRADQCAYMMKDGHRLVLSDENFIGVMHDRHGAMLTPLYPRAQERVAALAAALAPYPMDVFIGIRHPAGFLASAYGQALIGGTPVRFDDYLACNPLDVVQWAGLIARLRAIPQLGRIVVWQFEDYRWRFYKATAAMMGAHVDIRIAPIQGKVHVGLSQAAVDHVVSQIDAPDMVDLGARARRAYPVSATNPAFAPFNAGQIATATADYARQIAQIEQMAGVTVLRA